MSPARVAPGVNPLRDPRDRRLPRIAGPCGMVLFGVTGDLARKKLMPAIYDLSNRGLLPPGFALVGFARRDWADEDFGAVVHDSVRQYARTPFREGVWTALAEGIRFVPGTFDDDAAFDLLSDTVHRLEHARGTNDNLAFYLSIPPGLFTEVCRQLDRSGLARQNGGGWRRVVIEKPFGHDLKSARELNRIVESVFPPDSVFRIDHYMPTWKFLTMYFRMACLDEPPRSFSAARACWTISLYFGWLCATADLAFFAPAAAAFLGAAAFFFGLLASGAGAAGAAGAAAAAVSAILDFTSTQNYQHNSKNRRHSSHTD